MGWRLVRPSIDCDDSAIEYSRDGELCTIGNDLFILANIELPYGEDERFVWTCRLSLSGESFRRIDARWDFAGRENDEPAFGWLSSELPTYETSTLSLRALVHQRPVGERPWVELQPTEHPLALEQREGIGDARISAIYHAFTDASAGNEASP